MNTPALGIAIPNLFVRDMDASLRFYGGMLGFQTLFTWGTPPLYAQVRRDAAVLALRLVPRPVLDHDVAVDLLGAYVEVRGVDALFAAMQSAGASFHQERRDEPWGLRSFIVRDPDGNLLCFAGPKDDPT